MNQSHSMSKLKQEDDIVVGEEAVVLEGQQTKTFVNDDPDANATFKRCSESVKRSINEDEQLINVVSKHCNEERSVLDTTTIPGESKTMIPIITTTSSSLVEDSGSCDVVVIDNNNGNKEEGEEFKPIVTGDKLNDQLSSLLLNDDDDDNQERKNFNGNEQLTNPILDSINQAGLDDTSTTQLVTEHNNHPVNESTSNLIDLNMSAIVYPSVSYAELVKEELSTLDEVTRESSTGQSSNSDISNDVLTDGFTTKQDIVTTSDASNAGGSSELKTSTKPQDDDLVPDSSKSNLLSGDLSSWSSYLQSLFTSKLVWIIVVVLAILFTSPKVAIIQIISFLVGILFTIICIIPATLYGLYKYFIVWPEDGDIHDEHDTHNDNDGGLQPEQQKMSHSPSLLLSGQSPPMNRFKTYSGWVLLRASDADSLLGVHKENKGSNFGLNRSSAPNNQTGISTSLPESTTLKPVNPATNVLSVKKKTVHLRIDPPSFIRLASHKKSPSIKDDPKKVLLMSTSKPEAVKIIDLNKYPDKSLFIFKRGPKDVCLDPDDDDEAPKTIQTVSPKLKHVWSRRLPIVIKLKVPQSPNDTVQQPPQTITIVIWTRDCKDKEVLFWTLFPLFPIGIQHKKRMLMQKNNLKSKQTKLIPKSTSRPTDLGNISFHRPLLDVAPPSNNNNRRSVHEQLAHVDIDWPLNASMVAGAVGGLGSSIGGPANEWLNVFLDHCMRDFVTHIKWRKFLHRKMERKLKRIKLPNFMDPLKVRGVTVGSVPKLTDGQFISKDADGQVFLSFNLEAGYDGAVFDLEDGSDDKEEDGNRRESEGNCGIIKRRKAVFEMSLETKLNPKYFTQHQMLQLSSPSKDVNLSKNFQANDDNDSINENSCSESDTEDEDDEPTFESISSNEENESDDDLLDKSDLDDIWKLDTPTNPTPETSINNGNSESGLELSSLVSPGSSPSQSTAPHPLQSWSQRFIHPSPGKSLVDRFTDKIKIKSRQILANNPTVRKYFDTVTGSKIGVTVRVNGLKGKLIVCLSAPPSDRVWIKLDGGNSSGSSSTVGTPSEGRNRRSFGSSTFNTSNLDSKSSDNQNTSSSSSVSSNKLDISSVKLDLEVIVEMNRKALSIKSNFIRNLLEGRLRKRLIEILTTYDDLSLYPLLVLPSCFYSNPGNEKSVFCDGL